MSKIPPLNVQFELAMLWRTLNVLKSIDVPSVVLFYEKLIPNLRNMPQLSLSSYWGTNSLVDVIGGDTNDNAVAVDGSKEGKTSDVLATSLLNIDELDYLRHSESIDINHDPLQVIQNLYNTAAMFVFHNSSSSASSRDILLSACLNMAVKSGRINLLLHFMLMVLSLHENYTDLDVDINCIHDIINFVQDLKKKRENPSRRIIRINKHNTHTKGMPSLLSLTSPLSIPPSVEALGDNTLTVLEDPLMIMSSTSNKPHDHMDNITIRASSGRISGGSYRRSGGEGEGQRNRANGILLSFGKADHGDY